MDVPSVAPSFIFADLAGFTALTEAHGDEHAADVAAEFARGVRAMLPGHTATTVKTMGDAVLVHVEDAGRAVCLAEGLVVDLGRRHGALGVRVGLHTGPAVERAGDWFGATVNVAARVAALAQIDEVLLTRATLEAAAVAPSAVRELGHTPLRNVRAPLELFALALGDPSSTLELDPVCRMAVGEHHEVVGVRHEGQLVRFCSERCASVFTQDPTPFLHRLSGTMTDR